MKVLYLINYAGAGGSEKYVYNLVDSFEGKRCSCVFAYNEDGLLAKQLQDKKLDSFKVEMKNPFDKKAAKAIADICRSNGVDIIHTHYPRENCIANLAKKYCKGVKVVYTNHMLMPNNLMWKLINRLIGSKTDRVIAVCGFGKELLVKNGYPKKKIEVIYNGAPEENGTDTAESTIRQELGIPQDAFVVCTLARFSPEKRMDFLVDVIEKARQKCGKKIYAIIAGDGDLYGEITEKIKAKGLEEYIKCPGYRKDGGNILKASDVFVNTSSTEALSFALVEALSFGKACVVSRVGGNVEVVNEESGCGFDVDAEDLEGFSDAVVRLCEDRELYEDMCRKAKLCAKEKFSLEQSIDKTFEVYKNVLNK